MSEFFRIFYDSDDANGGTVTKKDDTAADDAVIPGQTPDSKQNNVGMGYWTGGSRSRTSKTEYAGPAVSKLFGTLFVRVGEDVQHEDGGSGSANNSPTGT